jgi:hypothetical protein
MDLTLKLSDLVIATATLLGPIFAVQAQKWLERQRAINERRRQIFRILMSTRATPLAPTHVEALNAVPVDFFGPQDPQLKVIVNAWRLYMDVLDNTKISPDTWHLRRVEQLVNLLFEMSQYLGYDFSKSQINKDVYRPKAHDEIETDQIAVWQGLAKLLKGEISIPMSVRDFPSDPEALRRQEELREQLVEWLSGKRVVKVEGVGQANVDEASALAGRETQSGARRRSRTG